MPQDPSLYGQPPPKKQKKEMALSSSLDFTSQLTSLLSNPASTTTARPRPSKSKTADLFSNVKAKRRPGAKQPNPDPDGKLTLRTPTSTEEEKATLSRARRKMEEKARLYAAMKRGDYVPAPGEAAPLVDFDRKWAESQKKRDGKRGDDGRASSSGSDDDSDDASGDEQEETVEYEDEFGRLRTAPRSAYLAHQRRLARGLAASTELEAMAARPRAPERVIYGEAIQAEAFEAADPDRMAELARKRDRSATPPEARHYDAAEEIRNRGTGFFAFSRDEEVRREEMEGLARQREETERVRREREERLAGRKREVEERRRAVLEKRREKGEEKARKMADSFLDALEPSLLARQTGLEEEESISVAVRDGGHGPHVPPRDEPAT